MIPSSMTLMKLDSITQEEFAWMNETYPSYLEPKTGLKRQMTEMSEGVSPKHGQKEEQEDCEKRIKEAIPELEFVEAEYLHGGDHDRATLRVTDFKQSYDYSKTTFGQLYSYYTILERVLSFELSLIKTNTSLLDTLSLEEAITTGMPFWAVDPEAAIHKRRQADSALSSSSQSKQQKLSERVIEKIVAEKRAKINLAEEVVGVSQKMGQLLQRISHMHENIISGKAG